MMKSIALKNYSFFFLKLSTGLAILLFTLFAASQVQAYEAHTVGVTATIKSCDDSSPHCLQVVNTCIKINEVYYDVDEEEKGDEGKNEWIEIYNTCDTDIRLQDWTLNNGAGRVETITTNRPIGAYEFWVISHDNETCGNLWSCDPNQHLNLGNYPYDEWLNDNGDHITLKDPLGREVDAVSWGTDTYAFDPSVADVDQGHSIARKEKGVDTDTAADWEDLADPNPGTNPHSASDQSLTEELVPFALFSSLPPENPGDAATGETTDSAATSSSENTEGTSAENSDTPPDEITGEATDSAATENTEEANIENNDTAAAKEQNPAIEQEDPATTGAEQQTPDDPVQAEDQDVFQEIPAATESTENQDATAQDEQSSDDQNQDEAIKEDDAAIIKEDDNTGGGDAGNNPADAPSDAPPPDSPDQPTDQV